MRKSSRETQKEKEPIRKYASKKTKFYLISKDKCIFFLGKAKRRRL